MKVRHLVRGQSLVPAGSPTRESPQGGEEEEEEQERAFIHLLSIQYLLSTCCGLNETHSPPSWSFQAANTVLYGDKPYAENTGQAAGGVGHGEGGRNVKQVVPSRRR